MVFSNNRKKAVIIIVTILVIFASYEQITNNSYDNNENPTILLIDNLSHINNDFCTDLEKICHDNNYDLVIQKDAEVKYFKNLNGSFSLIILRLHSTNKNNVTWLFTNEEYKSNKYILEQLAGEIHSASLDYSSGVYFVLSSYYLRHYISGKIKSDCVILMGCNGMDQPDMAQAWIDAGAGSYVGWKGDISINDTDFYTKNLVIDYLKYGLENGLLNHVYFNGISEVNSRLMIYSEKK